MKKILSTKSILDLIVQMVNESDFEQFDDVYTVQLNQSELIIEFSEKEKFLVKVINCNIFN